MIATSALAQSAPTQNATYPKSHSRDAQRVVEPVRSLLIAGERSQVANLALKRLGKAIVREQGFLILDYAGKLAQHLSKDNSKALGRFPITWLDLCNRRKPIAVWRLAATPGMPLALAGFLRMCAARLKVSLSPEIITGACALAWRMVGSGTMGLVSLAQSLRRPELNASLRMNAAAAKELDALVCMLHWLLRFPLVWAACEGNNTVDIEGLLAGGHTVWMEMAAHYAQTIEHEILGWMAQARVLQMLGSEWPKSLSDKPAPMLAHAFAHSQMLDAIPRSSGMLAQCKQVMLQELGYEGVLPAAGKQWMDAQTDAPAVGMRPDCWILGGLASPLVTEKNPWLTQDECIRLAKLPANEVWVQSGKDRRAVVMLTEKASAVHSGQDCVAMNYRRASWRTLKLSSVKQWGFTPAEDAVKSPPNADIFRHLYDTTNLLMGWFRVKDKRKNSHGIDRVTIAQFGQRLDDELLQLEQELSDGSYRPRPLRVVRLEKPDGGERLIKVACVRDRVVQAAFLHQVEPLFEPHFSSRSYAYRLGRSPAQALALVRSAIRAGKRWAVVADIQKCFDSLDHDILMRLFADRVADRDVLRLLRSWLQADVFDMGDVRPADLGVAQGETISPLLANIYLDPMDKVFEREGLEFVRYADDYVILCDNEAQARAALALMSGFLQHSLHLSLKPAKTQVCALSEGISFLGFTLTQDSICIPAEKIVRVTEAMRTWVQLAADREALQFRRVEAMQRLNALIRGYRNYYALDGAPLIDAQLSELDGVLLNLGQQYIRRDDAAELMWASKASFAIAQNSTDQHQGLPDYGQAQPVTSDMPDVKSEIAVGSQDAAANFASAKAAETSSATSEAVLRIERSLHVMQGGCYITRRDDQLVIRKSKKDIYACPMEELDIVMAEGMGIALSCDLGMHLAERDIALILAPLVGRPSAALQALASSRSNLRREQVLRALEPDVARAGLAMLAAKTANQASVLHYFAKYRKKTDFDLYSVMNAAADHIRQGSRDLLALDPSDHQLRAKAMGLEGRAASHYWGAIGQLAPANFKFAGRQTHKASDPINSALNYIYSLLYAQVWRAVASAGLDPYFGIIHRSERDQGSLVFDVIEEFRAPFADKVLFSLLGRGLNLELDKDGMLGRDVRKKMITAFHKNWRRSFAHLGKVTAGAQLLAAQVRQLRHVFLATGEYAGYRFRW